MNARPPSASSTGVLTGLHYLISNAASAPLRGMYCSYGEGRIRPQNDVRVWRRLEEEVASFISHDHTPPHAVASVPAATLVLMPAAHRARSSRRLSTTRVGKLPQVQTKGELPACRLARDLPSVGQECPPGCGGPGVRTRARHAPYGLPLGRDRSIYGRSNSPWYALRERR